mgnify:CR=1 FL=1
MFKFSKLVLRTPHPAGGAPVSNYQNFDSRFHLCLEHSNIWILDLPFDLAQGGELVEPFRFSCFDIRILINTAMVGNGCRKINRETQNTKWRSARHLQECLQILKTAFLERFT